MAWLPNHLPVASVQDNLGHSAGVEEVGGPGRLQHSEAPQHFMASMSLSQAISGPTHQAGPKLDLAFCSDQVCGDLKVGEV